MIGIVSKVVLSDWKQSSWLAQVTWNFYISSILFLGSEWVTIIILQKGNDNSFEIKYQLKLEIIIFHNEKFKTVEKNHVGKLSSEQWNKL